MGYYDSKRYRLNKIFWKYLKIGLWFAFFGAIGYAIYVDVRNEVRALEAGELEEPVEDTCL